MNVDVARLVTHQAAYVIDSAGLAKARIWIFKIRAAVPNIAIAVIQEEKEI